MIRQPPGPPGRSDPATSWDLTIQRQPQEQPARELRMARVKETCLYMSIGKTRVYQLINEGILDARKSGRSTLIDLNSADRYLSDLPSMRSRELAIKIRAREQRKRKPP
jgi:excisionase family DNA binding protein